MRQDEPEITLIARFIATRIRNESVPYEQAVDAWRSGLRYARATGIIDQVVEDLKSESPTDHSLHTVLDVARR
jgi:hypothetical protein